MRASYSFAMSVVSNRLIAPPCGWPCMHASITRHHHSLRAAADLLGLDFPLIFRTSVAIQSPYGVLCPAAKKSLYKPGAVMVHIVGFMFVAMSSTPAHDRQRITRMTQRRHFAARQGSSPAQSCHGAHSPSSPTASPPQCLMAFTLNTAASPLGLLCTPAQPSRRATVIPSRRLSPVIPLDAMLSAFVRACNCITVTTSAHDSTFLPHLERQGGNRPS